MKRLHVHVSVDDLAHSIQFYSALFATNRRSASPIMRSGCSMIRG